MPRISAFLTRVSWAVLAMLVLAALPADAQRLPTLLAGYAGSPGFRARLEAAAADSTNQPWQREFLLEMARGEGASGGRAPRTSAARVSSASLLDGTWEGLAPSVRYALGAIYDPVRDRMLVFGGSDGSSSLNDVWALSLAGTPAWTALTPTGTPPSGSAGHSAIYDPVRDRVVVFGGNSSNDVWALSLAGTPAWTVLTPTGTPPSARSGHSAIYDPVRDRMVVFGGNFSNDAWALHLAGTPAWMNLTPTGTPPSGRNDHSAIYDPVRDRMVMFGGQTSDYIRRNDVWALSLAGAPSWTALTPYPSPSARSGHSAIYDPVRDRMVIFGGFDGNMRNDVWALSLVGTPAWISAAPPGTLPSGRRNHSAIYDPMRDRMLVFGGYASTYLNDVWALSLPGTPTWTTIAPAGAPPSARYAQSAIYDPVRDRMVVFGGTTVASYFNDVWALSLAGAPSWTVLTPAGTPPTARYDHSAIYDPVRDRMVVFGGYAGNYIYLNDVWELSLAGTPAWTILTPTGTPPNARVAHSAIYDPMRDRMVVFGGTSNTNYFNDVWALSLAGTPTWTELTPTGTPPTARYDHSAIYDPVRDQMVVFDGPMWALSLAGTPAWTVLTPTGIPPGARNRHSAIYDPVRDRMVVFGGHDGSVRLNDVWALSLVGTPAWTALAPASTPPSARFDHSAIYDPVRDRMSVFGGSGGTYLNDVWALEWSAPPPPSMTIIATAGLHGSITPSGAVAVAVGASQTFNVSPDACYSVSDVLIDGASVGMVSSYTFSNVTADHTIAVSFAASTYLITTSANTGGSITPEGPIQVNCGGSQGFTITPDACYSTTDVLVDGASILGVSSYTFSNVTGDHSISAVFSFKGSTLDDADGDGLLDEWETTGIPVEGGDPYLLSGADPQHKDLYVEVDAMAGHAPDQVDLQRVRGAFAASGVCNPDGEPGIRLHVIGAENCNGPGSREPCVDDADVPAERWPFATWLEPVLLIKNAKFGTAAERTAGGVLPAQVFEARKKAIRYCVFGDSWLGQQDNSGYCSGDNFVVTLGKIRDVDTDKRAGSFMHELGHSLGLGHGGGDRVNFKPNYFSVMNYLWQWPAALKGALDPVGHYRASWQLDYSKEELNSLDEGHLDEMSGIGGNASFVVPIGPLHPGFPNKWAELVPMGGPVNWSADDFSANDRDVSRDINDFSVNPPDPDTPVGLTTLQPHDDWNSLRYYTAASTLPSAALAYHVSMEEPPEEMTQATYDSLSSLHFDCNGNEVEDAQEILDGTVADANDNGVLDPCEGPAILTAVDEARPTPSMLSLDSISRETGHEVRYSVPKRARTTLRVFDVTGRLVVTLVARDVPAGIHQLVWGHVDAGGRAVASGVYFVVLESDNRRAFGKIVVLR